MVNLFYDCYVILTKVYSEGAFLKQAMLNQPIEEKNRAAVTKICYGVLDKDILLSARIDHLCEKKPKLSVRTVLKIAMYNITFLGKAPYAVTDAAVELLSRMGKKGVCGFVNAVLRKYPNTQFPVPEDDVERLSLQYDYPVFAVKNLIDDYGMERAQSIMSASAEKTCLRFSGVEGKEYLSAMNIEYIELPYENAFLLNRFVRNRDYDKGIYTFQSVGSMAICEAVGSGEWLLDACAAPGGKSVLLSERFKKVIAQEIHPHRAELISEYAGRMIRNNIEVVVGDAAKFNGDWEEKFDAVLCDVPCSGFGVIKTNPDIKLKKSEETVIELNAIQLSILKNCASYVKRGGKLIYSTCSLFNQENDEVVSRFLEENKAFTSEIISVKIPYIKRNFGVQLLPDISFGAGFYISVLRRAE